MKMFSIFVIIHFIAPTQALLCNPTISEGAHSKLEVDGRVSLECKISDCNSVSKIKFEKTDIHNLAEWTPVFEGINNTYYYYLNNQYLANRSRFVAFDTKHILDIDPLNINDQGKWRCVVDDHYYNKYVSDAMVLQFESVCKPEIRGKNDVNINGILTLECLIATCKTVSKVLFETKGISWTPVYEESHGYRHALHTDAEYSLNRTGITYAYNKEYHTLTVQNIILQDQGEWRCIVQDGNNVPFQSLPMHIHIHVFPREEKPSIRPINPALVTHQTCEFTCMLDGIHPEPDVIWKVNGIEYHGGIATNTQYGDGLWFAMNTIRIDFAKSEKYILSCVMKTKIKTHLLQNHVSLHVRDGASVSEPHEDINITLSLNTTFTLHCTGNGYKPNLVWQKEGAPILGDDARYNIKTICNITTCESSLTSIPANSPWTCNDLDEYTGVYSCVISLAQPYESTQISSSMIVHRASERLCNEENGIKNMWEVVGAIVSTFGFVVCLLVFFGIFWRKRKKAIQSIRIYDYIGDIIPYSARSDTPSIANHREVNHEHSEMSGLTRNPTLLIQRDNIDAERYSQCSSADVVEHSYDVCYADTKSPVESGIQSEEDGVLYKRMDSEGHASYVTNNDIEGGDYLQMGNVDPATEIDKSSMEGGDYLQMGNVDSATEIDKSSMDHMEYTRMDMVTYSNQDAMLCQGSHTYINKEMVDIKHTKEFKRQKHNLLS